MGSLVVEQKTASAQAGDDTIRLTNPSDRYQTMFGVFNQLGIQSNIEVAATYSHRGNARLTRSVLYPALKKIILDHSELAMTYVRRPSTLKAGNHRTWTAHLKQVDLNKCVEFVEDPKADREGIREIIEKVHNDWFNRGESHSVLWKMFVVNGKHVIFAYDHYMGDGRSGFEVHRSLLEALNGAEQLSGDADIGKIDAIVDIPPAEPRVDVFDQIDFKPSVVKFIWAFLLSHLYNIIFFGTRQLFYDSAYKKVDLAYDADKPKAQITTKMYSFKIDAATVEKCREACHRYSTTVTGLLSVLIRVSLAADLYPLAKLGISTCPIDVRRDMSAQDGLHGSTLITNASSSFRSATNLKPYRDAGTPPTGTTHESKIVYTDIPAIWTLAYEFRAALVHDLRVKKSYLQGYKGMGQIGVDDEDYVNQMVPAYGLFSRRTYLVSNLGAFDSGPSEGNGAWSLTEMQFSAGAVKGGIGPELAFNVVGVKNGPTIVNMLHEKGVLEESKVNFLLERVQERLKAVLA